VLDLLGCVDAVSLVDGIERRLELRVRGHVRGFRRAAAACAGKQDHQLAEWVVDDDRDTDLTVGSRLHFDCIAVRWIWIKKSRNAVFLALHLRVPMLLVLRLVGGCKNIILGRWAGRSAWRCKVAERNLRLDRARGLGRQGWRSLRRRLRRRDPSRGSGGAPGVARDRPARVDHDNGFGRADRQRGRSQEDFSFGLHMVRRPKGIEEQRQHGAQQQERKYCGEQAVLYGMDSRCGLNVDACYSLGISTSICRI
jgi:hypothetical protein